jgi:hypothetical protein
MFWIKLLGLTALYVVVGLGVIFMVALYYGRKRKADHKELFKGYLWNNNTWFFWGLGVCAITFVFACFNFGPAVLLPEDFPKKEQRGVIGNVFNHLIHGKNAPAKVVPTEPLPWARGSWFWWKAELFYCLLTFGYFWFAFWDEATTACKNIAVFIKKWWEEHKEKKKHEAEHKDGKDGHRGGHSPGPTGHSFTELFKAGLLAEILVELLGIFIKRHGK